MNYRKKIDRLIAERRSLRAEIKREKANRAEASTRLADIDEARVILQTIAERVQKSAHERVADLVSQCLQSVFDEPYEFKIDFVPKRGRTEAELKFVRDGKEYDSPMSSSGGGVVDVAAFALRLASIVFSRPARRRLIVLDEPFKHLSREYSSRVGKMIEELAESLDMQILMVTHDRGLMAGEIHEIE